MLRVATGLILAGGFAALAASDPQVDTPDHLRAVTQIATLGARLTEAERAVADPRSISPYAPAAGAVPATAVEADRREDRGDRAQPVRVAQMSWPAVVTPAPRARTGPAKTEPTGTALVRDIQDELRRAGCYRGAVDGVWGPGSRGAMARLVSSVNARLPVDDPDLVLLALVRGQPDDVCAAKPARPATVVAEAPAARSDVAAVRRGIMGLGVRPGQSETAATHVRRVVAAPTAQPPPEAGAPRPSSDVAPDAIDGPAMRTAATQPPDAEPQPPAPAVAQPASDAARRQAIAQAARQRARADARDRARRARLSRAGNRPRQSRFSATRFFAEMANR